MFDTNAMTEEDFSILLDYMRPMKGRLLPTQRPGSIVSSHDCRSVNLDHAMYRLRMVAIPITLFVLVYRRFSCSHN